MLLTVVSPAYNEERNLPLFHERLKAALDGRPGLEWEWICVDDHSADGTFAALTRLGEADPRVRALRFSRNFGTHKAVLCGLHEARGACAVVISSDLQAPPEAIPTLVDAWRDRGSQIVWGERIDRQDEGALFSRLYYWLMRRVVGLSSLPGGGMDVFLIDRAVLDALAGFTEDHVSLVALLSWAGFRQSSVPCERQARQHGKSGWSLAKKIKLVIDSVTGFSYLPIRAISVVGTAIALLGFVYAAIVVGAAIAGHPPAGWSSLMVAVLVIGGVQMVTLGILGEYIWRALDQSRRRPRYLIEARTGAAPPPAGTGDAG